MKNSPLLYKIHYFSADAGFRRVKLSNEHSRKQSPPWLTDTQGQFSNFARYTSANRFSAANRRAAGVSVGSSHHLKGQIYQRTRPTWRALRPVSAMEGVRVLMELWSEQEVV